MNRFILASTALLFATPVFAQQPAQPQYTPTAAVLLNQALQCESYAGSEIASLRQQLTTVTKERDDLKAAKDKAEPAKK